MEEEAAAGSPVLETKLTAVENSIGRCDSALSQGQGSATTAHWAMPDTASGHCAPQTATLLSPPEAMRGTERILGDTRGYTRDTKGHTEDAKGH